MSEESTEATTEVVEQAESAPDTGTDLQADVEKWRSLARKHEQRAKENSEKALKYDEVVESQKTEQQKLADKLAAAENRAAELEASTMRVEVAAEYGVPADMLTGSTREELESYADRLVQFRGKAARPDFGGGDRGTDFSPSGGDKINPNDLIRAARQR